MIKSGAFSPESCLRFHRGYERISDLTVRVACMMDRLRVAVIRPASIPSVEITSYTRLPITLIAARPNQINSVWPTTRQQHCPGTMRFTNARFPL